MSLIIGITSTYGWRVKLQILICTPTSVVWPSHCNKTNNAIADSTGI